MSGDRILTNDYRDFQLMELGKLMASSGGRGPFMVVQDGIAPGDPRMRTCSFVLTRRGTWLHYYLFLTLPEDVRRRCALFESGAEALGMAGTLSGAPVVEDAFSLPELIHEGGFEPAETDRTGRALLKELRRRHPGV
jgi:hypothetical protein